MILMLAVGHLWRWCCHLNASRMHIFAVVNPCLLKRVCVYCMACALISTGVTVSTFSQHVFVCEGLYTASQQGVTDNPAFSLDCAAGHCTIPIEAST